MIKTFPKSRICVIDCFSSFEKGIYQARAFAAKHNISLTSADGKKLVLNYCLNNIQDLFASTKSEYPKVLCISTKSINSKVEYFLDNYFVKLMKQFSVPYCGKHDLNSPDLELSAETSLKHTKKQTFFSKSFYKKRLKI